MSQNINTHSNNIKLHDIYLHIMNELRLFFKSNNFNGALIGLSGGIDSAFVATILLDCFGDKFVKLISMPSIYTTQLSLKLIKNFIKHNNLSKQFIEIPIQESYNLLHSTLNKNYYKNSILNIDSKNFLSNSNSSSIANQNLQARIRAIYLMYYSNLSNYAVINTTNKSELMLGYGTIYGDLIGSFAPIKHLYKTEIFALARWRNDNIPATSNFAKNQPIETDIINRKPSAELDENQYDENDLLEYHLLDKILFEYEIYKNLLLNNKNNATMLHNNKTTFHSNATAINNNKISINKNTSTRENLINNNNDFINEKIENIIQYISNKTNIETEKVAKIIKIIRKNDFKKNYFNIIGCISSLN